MTELSHHTSFATSANSSTEALVNETATEPSSHQEFTGLPHGNSPEIHMEEVPLLLETPPSKMASTPTRSRASMRSIPRLNTRTSVSGSSLPWQIDPTSSPSTPSPYTRKVSYVPPPRSSTSGIYTPSSTTFTMPLSQSTNYFQPENTPLSPGFNTYHHHTPPSPCTTSGHVIDLSHPPGYSQNALASFSDRVTPSSTPYGNHSPFYENRDSGRSSAFNFINSPVTPTNRRGRGILDNDPAIYLAGEGNDEDDTVWDMAAKWAKAATKRLSQREQQIWRLVSAIRNGELDR